MTIKTITIDTDTHVVVPRVPTQEMVRAGADSLDTFMDAVVIECYEAMIAAAPQPEQAQQDGGVWSDTGHAEADRVINRLGSSDPDFDDCAAAVALIRTLIANMKGPDGFATWKDAAVAERLRRVNAQLSTPRPVPTSERLPTAADADVTESVWLFNKMVSKWYLYHWRDVETAYISHWQPTGLVRPAEPDGGAV